MAGLLVAVPAGASAKPLKVVTTFTVIADIARNVAGNLIIVESVTKAGAEIHDYQPTPQDIVRARSANAILWNGLNLERWFERFFENIKIVPSFVVSDGIEPISIYEGPYSGKPNPHAWMSTSNALIYVENIRKAFVHLDPANAKTYTKNATAYSTKIRALRHDLSQALSNIPAGQRYLVTSEGAFSYLARDFELKELYLWPINAEQQGTPQQVRRIIDAVRSKKIPVIFSESTVSDRPAKQVATETGARYGGILYVDSLSEEGGLVGTYLDLLRITCQTIAAGFQSPPRKFK
jgi:manganese/iron transport system substrate-binding protein